jgi:hypothetical protein
MGDSHAGPMNPFTQHANNLDESFDDLEFEIEEVLDPRKKKVEDDFEVENMDDLDELDFI